MLLLLHPFFFPLNLGLFVAFCFEPWIQFHRGWWFGGCCFGVGNCGVGGGLGVVVQRWWFGCWQRRGKGGHRLILLLILGFDFGILRWHCGGGGGWEI